MADPTPDSDEAKREVAREFAKLFDQEGDAVTALDKLEDSTGLEREELFAIIRQFGSPESVRAVEVIEADEADDDGDVVA